MPRVRNPLHSTSNPKSFPARTAKPLFSPKLSLTISSTKSLEKLPFLTSLHQWLHHKFSPEALKSSFFYTTHRVFLSPVDSHSPKFAPFSYMEALSSSITPSKFRTTETYPSLQSSPTVSLIKYSSNQRCGCLRLNENLELRRFSGWDLNTQRVWTFGVRALEGEGGDEKASNNDELGLVPDMGSSWLEGNLTPNGGSQNDMENPKLVTPYAYSGNVTAGGSRAGLFRTPISGGVQSATSAHGLPRPALAVRNLMEQARFAHLCTVMSRMHHRREGYPFGSLVDFAPDPMGHPIFSFSPLAIHTRNLLADPRCTLVVQIPGWSGLSNARVTIFGDVYPLPDNQQEWAHKQYVDKHHQGASQQWGNFYYFRMHNISDIYFIGGFGTVAWVDVNEYENLQPDKIAVNGGEQNLKELNAVFSKPLKELLASETEIDDAALISIDSKGVDIRVRQGAQFNIQRLAFNNGHAVETLEEAKAALHKLINKDVRLRLHNQC